jgi:hypothetical protein
MLEDLPQELSMHARRDAIDKMLTAPGLLELRVLPARSRHAQETAMREKWGTGEEAEAGLAGMMTLAGRL